MNLMQRITTTLHASMHDVVSRVENHDAVAEAALNNTRAAAAKAKVRFTRIVKDGEAMRQKLAELQRMEVVWAERAVTSAAEDEAKALECVKRRNVCVQHIEQLKQAILRHEDVEREVGATVERIEKRLQDLVQQRNLMRSRHSAADAQRVINRIEGESAHGISDIFDRWEMLITETEYTSGTAIHSDALDTAFTKEETTIGLKADLQYLLDNQPLKK